MKNKYFQLSKNNSITFWKVVFTFAVVTFHYSTTFKAFNRTYHSNVGWRIAVEFFFIVSGFLLAYKCRRSEMTALQYTLHRYSRLFPEYFFSLLISVIVFFLNKKLKGDEVFDYLLNTTDELLMLQAPALSYVNINGALWYISAMVICGYFIYHLYKKYSDIFTHIIAPLSILVIYSYLAFKERSINGNIGSFTGIGISFALLRGFGAMSLGVLTYELYLKIYDIELTKLGEKVTGFSELLGYGIVLYYTFKFGSSRMDFIFLGIFTVCTVLSFSRKKKTILFNNIIVDNLGKITYSIYLIHIPVLRVCENILNNQDYKTTWFPIYLLLVVVFAVLLHNLTNAVSKGLKYLLNSNKFKLIDNFVPENKSKKAK